MSSFPVILSSPSGGGKTTIARELLERRIDVGYSVSCTTRAPRRAEVEGRDYYFLSRPEFDVSRAAHAFAEAAEVHGEMYGTLRREVDRLLKSGLHVVMDIDVQGARQFADAYPDSVLVFVLPPNADVLLDRLRARGTEDRESMARRLRSAASELEAIKMYQYVVVNDDLEHAVDAVSDIIDAEAARSVRIDDLAGRVRAIVTGIEGELTNINKGR
ncbi:MAG: guanylate kinase [Gemmatimonadaceae bacterium]|nr:guanylate kinase [Gemmatimonadaceae bacterium]